MPIFNITLARALPTEGTIFAYSASQHLLDVLLSHRFVELSDVGGIGPARSKGKFIPGQVYYFRKHGTCTVQFLKDGRIHVLNGPTTLWDLHDHLTPDEVNVLVAFSTLNAEQQEVMRNYMGKRCHKYTDIMRNLPIFPVDWKKDFLEAFSAIC